MEIDKISREHNKQKLYIIKNLKNFIDF